MSDKMAVAEERIRRAREEGWEVLDLGDLALEELPESLGELVGLRELYLGQWSKDKSGSVRWRYQRSISTVSELHQIQPLTSLEVLCLDYSPVEDLQVLSRFLNLQHLTTYSRDITDLAPLKSLVRLQHLDIAGTQCEEIVHLHKLIGLRHLNLVGTPVQDSQLRHALPRFKHLRVLELALTNIQNLNALQSVSSLQRLNISSTSVKDLQPLQAFTSLRSLSLFGTPVEDAQPLQHLQNLENLYLSQTQIKDLGPLQKLANLRSLSISDTPVDDVRPLSRLLNLQYLILDATPVQDLRPLRKLAHLRHLSLSETQVHDLQCLAQLQNLQQLNLSWVPASDLSVILGLERLTALNVYAREELPSMDFLLALVNLPALTELYLDRAQGIPAEGLSSWSHDNCLPRLRTYLAELAIQQEADLEVKVVLLGNGRVGKTQLCRRLRGEGFDASLPSTHGVQIWREELSVDTEDGEQTFHVNWWDFGGQDIYHGTHALFLRSRAIFLILWTEELEKREEKEEDGLLVRNQPLDYWLDYVYSLAGKDSAVIVVQSQCDTPDLRKPDPPRPEGAGFFECCSANATKKHGRKELRFYLDRAIEYLTGQSGALAIGKGRAEVRRQLYAWRDTDQGREPEAREHRTLSTEEFEDLCDKTGGIVDPKHALHFFHRSGVLFHDEELFESRIILDQTWALDAIYAVFDRENVVPWLRDGGEFTRRDLAATVWQKHSPEEHNLFLGMMKSCGICFPVDKLAGGELRYAAPDLLPPFDQVGHRLYWSEAEPAPTLRLEYDFFHPSLIRRLMSTVGTQAGRRATYWRYGLWFKDGKTNSLFKADFIDTSTDEDPGAGALELSAQGRDPLSLLREVRRFLAEQRIGEDPRELLTLGGLTVERKELEKAIDGKVHTVAGAVVDAQPYRAFFAEQDERQHRMESEVAMAERLETQGKAHGLDVDPQETKMTQRDQVFISYSHKDNKYREELEEHLSVLELDVWSDKRRIAVGDKWRDEIEKALARAKVAVLLVSRHFLASGFIKDNELPPLLAAEKEGGLRVVWVPVRPSRVDNTPINEYQAASDPGKPLQGMKPAQRDKVWVEVSKAIEEAAK